MYTLNLFDFNLIWAVVNGIFAFFGFLGFQFWEFKKDEENYTWTTRKGDFLFGIFFIPLVMTFGAPYFWDWIDKNTWYNPLTSMTIAFFFDYVIAYGFNFAKKQSKEV